MKFTTDDASSLVGRENVADASQGARMRGVPASGAYIKKRRRSRGLTQEALANAAHCDIKSVYRAESGAHLDIATLARLARALGVPYRRVVEVNEGR